MKKYFKSGRSIPSQSFYGERSETGESIKHYCQMDTPVKPEYDKKRGAEYDRGMAYGRSPFSVSLGRSETKTRGSIMAQSGRSMVEMLGTLAIIGVLSVGGIMGYSYGMDKYHANQTVNDIMLRAVDLMTQASQGRSELSFAEWKNEDSIYDFSAPAYSDDGLIMFDVGASDKIPQSVCAMIFDNLNNVAIQIDINAERTDTNATCGKDNTMTFYFEGGKVNEQGELICSPECGEGEQCTNGFCFKEDTPIVSKMYGSCSTHDDCGGCGTCAGKQCMPEREGLACPLSATETGQCNNGQCLPKEGCSDKNPCQESGTYCASTNSSCTEAFGENETGVCIKPDFVAQEINGQIYYISNGRLSWWDAKSACQTINRDMLSINDVVIGWDKTSSNTFERTALGKALNSIIIHGIYVWTEAVEGDDCKAWTFQPNYWGDNYYIQKYSKNSCTSAVHYIAVCK